MIKRDPQIWGKSSTSEELEQHIYLTYGTISDEGIKKLLDDIHKLNSDDVFYDLGSGIGKMYVNTCLKIPMLVNVLGLNMIKIVILFQRG